MKYQVSVQRFQLFYILFIVFLSVVKSVSYIAIAGYALSLFKSLFSPCRLFPSLQFICWKTACVICNLSCILDFAD